MASPFLFRRFSRSGFTLLELLAVITIIGIMTLILLPPALGIFRSYKLNTVTQTVSGQLNMARQSAATRGRAVQVRFYYLPDFNQTPNSSPAIYRGMQCFTEGETTISGTNNVIPLTPLTKPVFFTAPVILLEDIGKSTLLDQTRETPIAGRELPDYALNYSFVSFRFRPDGKTDLVDNKAGITLMLKGEKLNANGLPNNFSSIEIDPRSGTIRNYRP